MTRDVPFLMHTMKILPICFGDVILYSIFGLFETFANEKCINATSMKLNEDFVLFGNAKDFESGEIFDFIILFAKFFYIQT